MKIIISVAFLRLLTLLHPNECLSDWQKINLIGTEFHLSPDCAQIATSQHQSKWANNEEPAFTISDNGILTLNDARFNAKNVNFRMDNLEKPPYQVIADLFSDFQTGQSLENCDLLAFSSQLSQQCTDLFSPNDITQAQQAVAKCHQRAVVGSSSSSSSSLFPPITAAAASPHSKLSANSLNGERLQQENTRAIDRHLQGQSDVTLQDNGSFTVDNQRDAELPASSPLLSLDVQDHNKNPATKYNELYNLRHASYHQADHPQLQRRLAQFALHPQNAIDISADAADRDDMTATHRISELAREKRSDALNTATILSHHSNFEPIDVTTGFVFLASCVLSIFFVLKIHILNVIKKVIIRASSGGATSSSASRVRSSTFSSIHIRQH